MNAVDQLIKSLDSDYNPDYWADHVKAQVAAELAAIDDAAWARIDQECLRQRVPWRLRLVDALTMSDQPRAIALLTRMLASPEPEVGRAITEALLDMNYQWSPGVSFRADLERHLANVAAGDRRSIERLLRRIPP